jgi:hypothetical protein
MPTTVTSLSSFMPAISLICRRGSSRHDNSLKP